MKRQHQSLTQKQEIEILSKQLDPEDMYIIGYIKGFDRKLMKEWSEKGIWEY
ncbi:MAG: hypothetical protein Q8N99_04590 [Nanoarchaeota archaeon]|nr:hypothetical protein [Nanoarchaeota archaeon]